MGGGPAPVINGVISAATIEAINRGFEVIGIRFIDVNTESYEVAEKYMMKKLRAVAKIANMKPGDFKRYFSSAV